MKFLCEIADIVFIWEMEEEEESLICLEIAEKDLLEARALVAVAPRSAYLH